MFPVLVVPLLAFLEPFAEVHVILAQIGIGWMIVAAFVLLMAKVGGDESTANFWLRWFWLGAIFAFIGFYALLAAIGYGAVRSFWTCINQ